MKRRDKRKREKTRIFVSCVYVIGCGWCLSCSVVTRLTSRGCFCCRFNTTLPGFVVADQFLQITTRLSNSYVYGFGEHRHETFRHDMNWRTWSIFTRDNSPDVSTWRWPKLFEWVSEWWEKKETFRNADRKTDSCKKEPYNDKKTNRKDKRS